jgi:hypothetical protein
MKNFVALVSLMILSLNAFALEKRLVDSKWCDGKPAAVSPNEAVLFEESKSLIAFRQDDASGCAAADFYVLLLNSYTGINSDKVTVYQPVFSAGKKNCKNEVLPGAPIFFETLTMRANSVELTKANGCELLILNLKPNI